MLYSYSKPKSKLRQIAVGLFILWCIYNLMLFSFKSVFYVFLAALLFSTEGFQLNTTTLRFRKTTVFWKWHFGKWSPITEPLYVIVIRAKVTSIDTDNNPNDLIIRLFLKTSIITVSSTPNYQEALQIANDIATKLEIPFHNKTTE